LTAPATDADRIRLARLLASGRADAVCAALRRLAAHRAAGDLLISWQRAATDLLAVANRPRLRAVCLAEAARLRAEGLDRRPQIKLGGVGASGGVRRYGPPPRLTGCKGKTVRWRHVPTPT
jgi:hypothetical protein